MTADARAEPGADVRSLTLAALCDTLLPAVAADGEPDRGRRAFLARSAADLGLAAELAGALDGGAGAVLDALAVHGFAEADADGRTALLHELARTGGDTRQRLRELNGTILALAYSLVDAEERNPGWDAIGYPGPISAPPTPEQAPKTIPVERVAGDTATLAADVCVVGSGAGGSVVAAELQRLGLAVVVLEAGDYRNEADFRQLELVGARELYLGGGVVWSETGSVGLLAGSTLGGGTVVNSLVCLRPTPEARREWAEHGIEGAEDDELDRHVDAVWARLGVTTAATKPNRTNRLLAEALERCGLSHVLLPRNASPDDDPRYCGYCNSGCQHGYKQSTLKTYLQDAADAGARFVVRCRAERVLVDDGRAVGVAATVAHGDGSATALVVEAPVVVVAAGGIGSPALLLRSGIDGPATGKHLRLHPTYFVSGVYGETIDGWSGQFQAVASFDRTRLPGGGGFLIESVALSPSFWAAQLPWRDGASHKREMLKLRRVAPWHALTHDHGSGEVFLGPRGAPRVRWELTDEVDRRAAAAAHVELARLHRAAGAEEIYTFHRDDLRWRRGEDFDAYVTRLERADHGTVAFSAHQMGSCRMGRDPQRSVADGRGELHDVRGVWIGDASAFPTAPGVNPMISVMALARRTASRIAATHGLPELR